jgi:spore germination cell wall hydrolase CwlJ-like protein
MKTVIKTLIATAVAINTFVFSAFADEFNIIDQKKHPELYCLALNIYFESRGESVEGQYAVADVTLNRVESEEFPNTICKVVYQCKKKNACQFAWVHEIKNSKNPEILEREAWHDAQLFAAEVFRWDIQRGITDGATYFHSRGTKPDWKHKFELTGVIGTHLFYRDPNRG